MSQASHQTAVRLGIAASALALRLRRDEPVVGDLRRDLIVLLGDVLATSAGRPQVRLSSDPLAAIELMVSLCRQAGMSGYDLAAAFNDAVERS